MTPRNFTDCAVEGCERAVQARGWCHTHYMRWYRHGEEPVDAVSTLTTEQRFWEKVDRDGPVPEYAPHLGPCWIWTGRLDGHGYGQFSDNGNRPAHRYAYELLVAPIPAGLEPDHLCRVPTCVNPSHLEPVTHRENTLRSTSFVAINAAKTHCPQGHPYDGANTGRTAQGHRWCRTCRRAWNRAYKRSRRAAA